MAKEGALDELLAEVLSRYDNSPNPRLKEVTTMVISLFVYANFPDG